MAQTMSRNLTSSLLLLTVAGLLAACGGRLDDARYPTGSSSIISSTDYAATYTVDPDSGIVARVDAETGLLRTAEVGGEPTRLARADGRVLVTLRAERAIAVLEETGGSLELSHTVSVGAEPFGIVASEDGSRVYVAESTQNRVTELDGETLTPLRSWDVDGEPRWLALHPSGDSLYVGSAYRDSFAHVDLDGDAVTTVGLPVVTSVHRETFEEIELTGRVTGDLAVAPNGRALAIPTLYVDNVSPVSAPSVDGDGNPTGESADFEIETGGYGGAGPKRFNPGVVLVSLDPSGDLNEDDIAVVEVGGNDGDIVRVGYPGAVTFTPDGETVLASLEAAGAVVAVTMETPLDTSGGNVGVGSTVAFEDDFFFGGTSMQSRAHTTTVTDAGPRGLAFLSKTDARVHAFLDRTVAPMDAALAADVDAIDAAFSAAQDLRGAGVEFAGETLAADVAEGRRLFYAADNPLMSFGGSAVSCSTCHLDGRTDGLTWTFAGEIVRQTPSLAGAVSLTAPVTWTDSVATVADEVVITSQGRMGGLGLARNDAEKVAQFIDWTREVDVPLADSTDDAIVRGQEVFERDEVGCADCHHGAAYTDNEPYAMYGLDDVRTRSLVGIAASAPYFHDGSSSSIRAVLERVRDGSMGDTSSLTDGEMDDLEAYVLSL